ncbi:glycosyl transferase GTB-type super family [Candidatus Termititenax dinenymphae]|uniref:Glycosyl transferase GTB-type super family n=1 Tax=Candidatus Termititenax dinenymphae TaxID=2218523 RepID=A0A388TKG3_9BACT|nr:glycosyl transferase GTB-type super family [Candidatus Termititenax dinenymphae]
MRILMLGWEYPPVKSGGLGTACYGLTKELSALGHDIIFVAPFAIASEKSRHLNLLDLSRYKIKNSSSLREQIVERLNLTADMKKHITYEFISSLLNPYLTEQKYSQELLTLAKYLRKKKNLRKIFQTLHDCEVLENDSIPDKNKQIYGANLLQEVYEYSLKAEKIAAQYDFDLIVAHDWMTFEAAVRIKRLTGKPFCAHIHATEFDRTGGNINKLIYDLELLGLREADTVIANSHFTKENCLKYYHIDPRKVMPIHLAMDKEEVSSAGNDFDPVKTGGEKFVLFLGRLTMQKGPEYFLRAAAKALQFSPEIRFIVAGSGEKFSALIELAAQLQIANRVFFTGFLEGENIRRVLKKADLFVMSSVAEPFGLVALEAVKANVPCIVSKTSGVSEILHHAGKVDFWDTDEMANQMVNILKYPSLADTLRVNAAHEVEAYTWSWTAQRTAQVYAKMIGQKELAYG